ncbi:hypothetical protein C8R41DRAFT_869669 [Lentinula lateritia]|uniref:Uncharacterized protein n=1 Tax=Lentinula lateritia TaxID=40482 RepID=A0ABQ8VAC8_9AGAR|nr:hypothetical protein C8R41DRAFT_869669 [Lentinula lateritia]
MAILGNTFTILQNAAENSNTMEVTPQPPELVCGQYQNKTNWFSEAQQDKSDNLNDRDCIPKAPGSNAHRFFAFRAFATSLEGFNNVSKSTACTCYWIAVDMTILTGTFVCTSIIWLIISVVGELVAVLLIVYYFYTTYLV